LEKIVMQSRLNASVASLLFVLSATACGGSYGSADDTVRRGSGAGGSQGTNNGQDGEPTDLAASTTGQAGTSDGTKNEVTTKPSYAEVVKSDQPVSYFRLGEAEPEKTSRNEVTGGLVGTYTNSVLLGQTGAIRDDPSNAVKLAGGYIDVGDTLGFSGRKTFSIEAWVRPDESPTYQEIVVKRDFDSASNMLAGYNLLVGIAPGNGVCIQRWSGSGEYDTACTNDAVSGTNYVHIVATYDGGTLALYRDGEVQQSVPSTLALPSTTSSFRIGGDPFFAAPYSGSVDEVAIYDHALSAARIAAHYQAGSGP
jgi:hypothetical protein